MSKSFSARDREVAAYSHKLFWRANFVNLRSFIVWALLRPAAILLYNVIIPFQVAYGLQAMISGDRTGVSRYALVIFISGILYCVLWAVGGVAVCRMGAAGTEFIQKEIFQNYLNKDYEYYNSSFAGALGTQASKLKDAYNTYNQVVFNGVIQQFIIVCASIGIIAYQSMLLAFATIVSMLFVLSFTLASGRWRLKYRRLLSESNSIVAGVVGDALSNGATVKSFANEKYENQHLSVALKKQVSDQYWSWMSSIPADVGRAFLATITTVALLVITSRLYFDGDVTLAVVILVQLYVIKLVNSTHEIAELIKTYESVMSMSHQAVKTMLIKPVVLDPTSPLKLPRRSSYTLELKNVSFRYDDAPKNVYAIKNFNITIRHGEKVGVVGYSGSGKTTLMKLLLRFMDVTEGVITIDGIDIRDVSQKELRRVISYVPQEPLLFHRSIAENIEYGRPGATRKTIVDAGKSAYVNEFVAETSKGYDTHVGEKGVKLSGGQRQRVAIARALLKDAPILVLDEATSALDSRSEQYIQKALWKLMKGRTSIVIAHRLSTIQKMDRIVVMNRGKIIEVGTHDELISNPQGSYANLWKHQSGGYISSAESKVAEN